MATTTGASTTGPRWLRSAATLAAALTLTTACTAGDGQAPHAAPGRTVAAASSALDSATRDDPEFNRQFRHETAEVDGVTMHYVTGGTGAPLVLLHGWPQSWYQDKYRSLSWHLAFHDQDTFPETVVADDVREYLALFFGYVAHGGKSFGGPGAKSPFTDRQLDEFARTYRRSQVLTGGFELYRTLEQDERDNLAAAPITMPVMLMTAEGLLDFTRSTVEPRMTRITRAVEVPGSGHWLPQENPAFVTARLLDFLATGGTR